MRTLLLLRHVVSLAISYRELTIVYTQVAVLPPSIAANVHIIQIQYMFFLTCQLTIPLIKGWYP